MAEASEYWIFTRSGTEGERTLWEFLVPERHWSSRKELITELKRLGQRFVDDLKVLPLRKRRGQIVLVVASSDPRFEQRSHRWGNQLARRFAHRTKRPCRRS